MASSSFQRLPEEQVVTLDLPEKVAHYFSSTDYAEIAGQGLSPADNMFTWGVRLPGVFHSIATGGSSDLVIKAASENLWVALGIVVLGIGLTSRSLYKAYQKNKADHDEKSASYKRINQRIGVEPPAQKRATEQSKQTPEEKLAIVNHVLDKMVDKKNIGSKYREIKVELVNNKPKLVLTFRKDIKRSNDESTQPMLGSKNDFKISDDVKRPSTFRKFLSKFGAFYTAVSFSSFAYWLLFISAAVFTGNFAEAGIQGVSAWAAFGLPVVFGGGYLGLKVRNWFKNGGARVSDEHARLTKIAKDDAPSLLNDLNFNLEMSRVHEENKALSKNLNVMYKYPEARTFDGKNQLGQDIGSRTGAEFYTSAMSTFNQAQFQGWIIGDFLKVVCMVSLAAPLFGPIVGGIMAGASLIFGGIEAYKKHKKLKETEAETKPENNTQNYTIEQLQQKLAANVEELRVKVKTLRASGMTLSPILEKEFPKPPEKTGTFSKIYNFFDRTASGIFFGRLMSVAGTTIFLPFVAIAASNPITIAILITAGILYASVKAYQDYHAKQEADTKALIANIKETDQQLDLADITAETARLTKIEAARNQPSISAENKESVRPSAPERQNTLDVVASTLPAQDEFPRAASFIPAMGGGDG